MGLGLRDEGGSVNDVAGSLGRFDGVFSLGLGLGIAQWETFNITY